MQKAAKSSAKIPLRMMKVASAISMQRLRRNVVGFTTRFRRPL